MRSVHNNAPRERAVVEAIVKNVFRTLVRQLSDCDVAVNEAFLDGLLTGCATIPAAKTADLLAAIGGGQPLPGAVRESVLDALDQLGAELSNGIYEARFDPGRSGDAQQDCVLADAADSGTDALEHAVDWLARMCGDDSEHADFRIVAGSTLLDLPRERHRPVMEALADLQAPALPSDYTRDDIEQAFEVGDRPEWERFRDPWRFYDPDEIERRQARWLREAEDRERYVPNRKVQTYRRESPKTGRNDPCPCGSGRKYKKCCLGATR